MKIFGREPALVLAFVAALVQVVSVFLWDLSDEQQGTINALAVAVVGLATAWMVAREKLVPAILGLTQAALALVVAFGLELTAEQNTVITTIVAAAVALFVRQNVVAPVNAVGTRVT